MGHALAQVSYTSPMSKIWRIVMTWLLVLALPVQGYAAQTMLRCDPAHHQSRLTTAPEASSLEHASMSHQASSASTHLPWHTTDADGHFTDHHSLQHPDPAGQCSACASCCSHVGIATRVPELPLMSAGVPLMLPPSISFKHVFVRGLDRPPRHAFN